MFKVKTTHRVTSIDTHTSEISRSTALRITHAPDYITDEALRERLFSAEYKDELMQYMRIYGGNNDYLHDEEVISDDIISVERD